MEDSKMFEKVKSIIAETLNCEEDKITLEANLFTDLGADSLDVYQIVMGVEDELGIRLPVDSIKKIKTVQEAVELIQSVERP